MTYDLRLTTHNFTPLLIILRKLPDGKEYAVIDLGKAATATGHHAVGGIKEFLHRKVVETGGPTLAERCDEIARETGTMDIDPDTHHRCRVEHSVDTGF